MLEIKIPKGELFDEGTGEFITIDSTVLHLEHSLISLTKWEIEYEKPFLNDENKNDEELTYYIKCMTLDDDVNQNCYLFLSDENINNIKEYMNRKMTATTISEDSSDRYGPRKSILTSEVIYSMMAECRIPFECEKWHLNRLITLIRVYNERQKPPKKMSRRDMLAQRRALNAQRIQKMKGK